MIEPTYNISKWYMQREIIREMKLPNVIVLLFRHYNIISSNRSPLWFLEAYIYSMLYHMGGIGGLRADCDTRNIMLSKKKKEMNSTRYNMGNKKVN
jgi:hypothetical protein